MDYSFKHSQYVMHKETGVVVPVYIPSGVDADLAESLLHDNVEALLPCVDNPAAIWLSVDGESHGADIAQRLSGKTGISITVAPTNRGKLQSIMHGVYHLTQQQSYRYLAVIDQDGDHFGNEMLNFIRTGEYITQKRGDPRVIVLGHRRSLHRPMGLLRGELEELADRVLLDMLMYHAGVTGRPLPLEYVLTLGEVPDFHSGYKLFDRATAQAVFLSPTNQSGVSDRCYYHHAVEAVVVVEALESGAYLGAVTRSTLNEQPISTFGLYNRIQLVADKIIWPARRLAIPPPFIAQWLANHIPPLLLNTLVPEGKDELEQIRKTVLDTLNDEQDGQYDEVLHPLFV